MKAYELLSDPSRWTQKTMARNKHGDATSPLDLDACSFCLVGAIERCYGSIDEGIPLEELIKQELKVQAPNFEFIGQWNDAPDRTHEEVVELLKKLDI